MRSPEPSPSSKRPRIERHGHPIDTYMVWSIYQSSVSAIATDYLNFGIVHSGR